MTEFSERMAATAARLIASKGKEMIVRTTTDEAPADPAKPWRIEGGTYVDQTVQAVLTDFRPDQVEGYAYQRGDKIIYVAGSSVSVPITEEDLILDGEDTYAIIQASRVNPQGVDIIFQLYVRQWPRRTR